MFQRQQRLAEPTNQVLNGFDLRRLYVKNRYPAVINKRTKRID